MVDQIEKLYRERQAVLGVVGMGYVGLPLMLAAAEAGYNVVGFDTDPQKIDQINNGSSYLKHIRSEQIASAVRENGLRATADFGELKVH